jgi:hypothetical protein
MFIYFRSPDQSCVYKIFQEVESLNNAFETFDLLKNSFNLMNFRRSNLYYNFWFPVSTSWNSISWTPLYIYALKWVNLLPVSFSRTDSLLLIDHDRSVLYFRQYTNSLLAANDNFMFSPLRLDIIVVPLALNTASLKNNFTFSDMIARQHSFKIIGISFNFTLYGQSFLIYIKKKTNLF